MGSLQFACIGTHPDISYAISVAAKYCANPSPAHYNALRLILKYLSRILSFGISFSWNDHPLSLIAYTDVDFAMDLDNCWSRPGFFFWGRSRSYSLGFPQKKPSVLAALLKHNTLAFTTKETIWHKQLLSSLGKPPNSPTHLFTDNQSALHLIKNPEFHYGTKHIDVQYHVIREAFLVDLIFPSFVFTHDQLVDIFIKALPNETFQCLHHQLGMCSIIH